MNIKVLKLITGEELIGDVTIGGVRADLKEEYYSIKKPAIIGVIPGQNGQPQLALADWLQFADGKDKEFIISNSKIMVCYTPIVQLINAYNKQFGSGIVIPQGGLITG